MAYNVYQSLTQGIITAQDVGQRDREHILKTSVNCFLIHSPSIRLFAPALLF